MSERCSCKVEVTLLDCEQAHMCEFRKNFCAKAAGTPEIMSLPVGN